MNTFMTHSLVLLNVPFYELFLLSHLLRSEAFTKAVSLAQLCDSYSHLLMGGFLNIVEVKKNQNNKHRDTMDMNDVKGNLYGSWGLPRSFGASFSRSSQMPGLRQSSQGRSSRAVPFP